MLGCENMGENVRTNRDFSILHPPKFLGDRYSGTPLPFFLLYALAHFVGLLQVTGALDLSGLVHALSLNDAHFPAAGGKEKGAACQKIL